MCRTLGFLCTRLFTYSKFCHPMGKRHKGSSLNCGSLLCHNNSTAPLYKENSKGLLTTHKNSGRNVGSWWIRPLPSRAFTWGYLPSFWGRGACFRGILGIDLGVLLIFLIVECRALITYFFGDCWNPHLWIPTQSLIWNLMEVLVQGFGNWWKSSFFKLTLTLNP